VEGLRTVLNGRSDASINDLSGDLLGQRFSSISSEGLISSLELPNGPPRPGNLMLTLLAIRLQGKHPLFSFADPQLP
jgi:hypothetical protein